MLSDLTGTEELKFYKRTTTLPNKTCMVTVQYDYTVIELLPS